MKKILLAALAAFAVSCSDDSQVASHTNNATSSYREGNATPLEEAYNDYINSESYLLYSVTLKDFVSKCSNTDELPDIFSSEEYMLDWISKNISSTEFQNYTEAIDEWQVVINRSEFALQNNPTFVRELINDMDGIYPILNPTAPIETGNSCEALCNQAADQCEANAYSMFNYLYAQSFEGDEPTLQQLSIKLSKAFRTLSASLHKCSNNLNKCMIKCH